MPETIRGTITRVYHSGPQFSAGMLEADDGRRVRFCGKFCANDGDVVALIGSWTLDRKYGHQFTVSALRYDLPDNLEGLTNYLVKHPAFVGIGEATARKLVSHAGSADALDCLIRDGSTELREKLRISEATISQLRAAWIANSAENQVRTYLAGFGLTHHQMNTLIGVYGDPVVSVLRADPYKLIQHVRGYGFKKVDKIARATGVAKQHPGRIEAGLMYCLTQQISDGHTWTLGGDLIEQANDLLVLDTLDAHDLIKQAGERLLERGEMVADGSAVTTPYFLDAERRIGETFEKHGSSICPLITGAFDPSNLSEQQADAYQCALRHRISVISGLAGTGKTYVVARLAQTCQRAKRTVKLCAPTGKAAKRIEELLRDKNGLKFEASTIHRMLEYNGSGFGVEVVDADMVIVDEVSMVDVPLMANLLERIDFSRTRLVMVGDHNQLPSVGPGNMLRDLVQHRLVPTIVLDKVHRQAGVLKINSTAVLKGEVQPTAIEDETRWVLVDQFSEAQQIQIYLRDLVLERLPSCFGYDPVRDVQVITPTHKGPLGTKAINQAMQQLLQGRMEKKFCVGDKVIQTSNDYELGVMNGTIGFVVDINKASYTIAFDGVGTRVIEGERLSNVMLAYALTAHKAQGSEFPCVVVLCHKSHFFADRNWLYTAVTRASQTCVLLGDRWGLRNAAKKNNVIHRRTFLSRWASTTQPPESPVPQEVSCG
jgi:exodeoxyribonuclease V alpha subunit